MGPAAHSPTDQSDWPGNGFQLRLGLGIARLGHASIYRAVGGTLGRLRWCFKKIDTHPVVDPLEFGAESVLGSGSHNPSPSPNYWPQLDARDRQVLPLRSTLPVNSSGTPQIANTKIEVWDRTEYGIFSLL